MIHPIVKILNAGDIAELVRADRTDGQLLDQYVKTRDADAFAMLVRRHGGLVLGVCRRVLRNHADADDAFQAAFLVLARKAATLRTRGLLSSWLHGVALNTARRLLRANIRRAARERPLADAPEPVAEEGIDLREELLAILDEELGRLPERYRVPIVLCDLEGATRKEAARLIGCPEGTVAGRLARARALLAERLAGRGIAPTAGILAAILTAREVGAGTLASGVMRTVAGDVSLRVASLAERVVAAMFLNKLKSSLVAVLACGLVLAGFAAGFRTDASANVDPMTPPGKPADTPAGEPKVLTIIPLRKLEPVATASVIHIGFSGKSATVAAIPDDRALMLYADAKTTREVEELLVKLGERFTKKESAVLRLKETKCIEAAKTLLEIFNGPAKDNTSRVTIVPVPDENSLLVYASPIDMLTIRRLLDKSLDAPPLLKPARPGPGAETTPFTLNFKGLPWRDAIAWYAEISGLSFVGDTYPKGTVTIQPRPSRKYTLAEITDLYNEALIQQKFFLIRRKTTFILHPADEKIDPSFIPRVEVDELKNYGRTEYVETEMILDKSWDATETADELLRLLTPFGAVVYAKGDRLILRDTAGNLTRIWNTIHDIRRQIKPLPEPRDPRYDPRLGSGNYVPRSALPTMPMAKTTPFVMKNAPWADVLDWYSKYSGLTPSLTVKPKGTFTFTPPKPEQEYTLGEITDILNESLAAQKLILLRRQTTFLLHPMDKKIELYSIPRIHLDGLPNYGNGELVQVLIPIKGQTVDEAAPEVKKMLSPQGVMSSLQKTNTLVIVDTAGSIRRIIKVLEGFNGKEQTSVYEVYHCKWQKADDVIAELNKRLGDKAKAIRVVAERASNSVVLISGPALTLALAKKLIAEIDAPRTAGDKPLPSVGRFPMQFKDEPWDDVLNWYSKISGLTPILTVKPEGKFTFAPPKAGQEYTIAEITDILNEAMAPQKFLLVRRQVTFYIHPTDKKVDGEMPRRVELGELGNYGKTELVQVLIPLKHLDAKDVVPEMQRLLTPFGSASALAKSNTLVVCDTAQNVSRIVGVIRSIEEDPGWRWNGLTYSCKWKRAQDVVDHVRPIVRDITSGQRGKTNDGRVRAVQFSVDEKANTLTYTAPLETIGVVRRLVEEFDKPTHPGDKPIAPDGADSLNHVCKYKKAQDVADHLKKLLDVKKQAKPVGIVVDPKANSVTVSGPPEKIAQAKKLIEEFDKRVLTDPIQPNLELRKYPVPAGRADATAKALLKDNPALRIVAVQAANDIWVMATPEEHVKLAAKLKLVKAEEKKDPEKKE